MNKKESCIKCGFTPQSVIGIDWLFAYKDQCYSKCDWKDLGIKEHLHQICPICGFTFSVPCNDYEKVKDGTWDTKTTPKVKTPEVKTPPVTTPPPSRFKVAATSGWNLECSGCPLSKNKKVLK